VSMIFLSRVSRRTFVQSISLATAGAFTGHLKSMPALGSLPHQEPLTEFGYGDVTLASELHERQLYESHKVLMELNEDSLLKPFRQMVGQPAPGDDLGGWYNYNPDYDSNSVDTGFAPSATFGQWVSALARSYAITGDPATRDKVTKLNRLYAQTIAGEFYENNRFPAYCYDKLVCGLIDSHQYVHDPQALAILQHTTNTALPHLPGKAVEHGKRWRSNPAEGYTWDESYTISENLFLAYQRGAGDRYKTLGKDYLLDEPFYNQLAEGKNALAGRHAYSHVNSLCSAMQAYLTLGSEKHLRAGTNGFEMLKAQSFATGGWGPDEQLRPTNSPDVFASLTNTHNSFETPCGSYAHFKLTRYLLRIFGDSRYGDSMERVMYNTILGAKPLLADGSTFYYSDYNFNGHKVFTKPRWPCCSGTFPQVAADYRINCYLCDANGLYVNLFIPSTVRWPYDDAQISLTQKSDYPFDGNIKLEVTASKPAEFSIHLRIPEWAEGATVAVNGKRARPSEAAGKFCSIRRTWKNGEHIEMELPLKTRLEAIDAQHPQTVALLRGPLVLFPIIDTPPNVTVQQLLAAKKTGQQSWQVATASGLMKLLPFTAIADEPYSTYMVVK
jgi:DUF1680 family protein